jgi:hypothetical protein
MKKKTGDKKGMGDKKGKEKMLPYRVGGGVSRCHLEKQI